MGKNRFERQHEHAYHLKRFWDLPILCQVTLEWVSSNKELLKRDAFTLVVNRSNPGKKNKFKF